MASSDFISWDDDDLNLDLLLGEYTDQENTVTEIVQVIDSKPEQCNGYVCPECNKKKSTKISDPYQAFVDMSARSMDLTSKVRL